MRHPRTILFTSLALLALPGPGSGLAGAQESPVEQASPRVESVEFEGVRGLDEELLRQAVLVQATRCRGLILIPLCKLSGSGAFWSVHDLDREELENDELRLRVTYFRRGYRQARVESGLEPEDDGVRVVFRIAEGPLTRVASLEVVQPDSVLGPDRIGEADLPGPEAPLDLVRLDTARHRLRVRLWDQGYADAEITDSVVLDPLTHRADLTVRIDAGRRATLDEVVVEGNERVSDHTIVRLFGIEEGALYRRMDMTAAQRRLWETELFRQSLVQVPPTEDSAKTVVISVREAPPRAVSAGPGFNTVEFFQGEARFTRYNWLGGARRLDARLAVGNLLADRLYGRSILGSSTPSGVGPDVDPAFLEPTWQMGVSLNQPFFLTPTTALGLGVSAHRRSLPGIVVDRGTAADVSLTRRLDDGIPVSLIYRFERNHVDAGEVYFCVNFGVCDPATIEGLRRAHRLSPLGVQARVERSDDPITPNRGYLLRLDAEIASALTLSDFRHVRIAAEASRYLRMGRGVLAGRVGAGWVGPLEGTSEAFHLADGDRVILHPRRRFFAGGSRSVRGYGENQLGPRVLTVAPSDLLDPPGDDTEGCDWGAIVGGGCDPDVAPSDAFRPRPLGGNTLLEASVEYRTPLTSTLTGAVFVDAGLVYGRRLNFPPGDRTAFTPGLGVRYESPVGPVRVDLGIRPSLVEELPVVTEVPGPDGRARLVQLDDMKRYDPLEGSGGFFSQILRRLQLHLAIGEAF